ncbi:hypothetical protein GCM10009609_31800 [Pseudonocardia aurantiaca]
MNERELRGQVRSLAGHVLARWLAAEDRAEDAGRLDPDDRLTCHVHGRWIHQCVSSPVHVNPVTRHRWCRDCAAELTVAVDELAGTVTMRCPRCSQGSSAATARLSAACRASLSLANGNIRPRLVATTWSRRGGDRAAAHGGSTTPSRRRTSAPA